MTPFPYSVGYRWRKIVGKPTLYKGWTIYHYKIWCQQTGSSTGEWRNMTLAVKGEEIIHCGVYALIDDKELK